MKKDQNNHPGRKFEDVKALLTRISGSLTTM